MVDRVVRLQVGARTFVTKYSTLTTGLAANSIFPALLNGQFSKLTTENHDLFLDDDEELFAHLLNYLRRGVVASDIILSDFERFLQYYEIGRFIPDDPYQKLTIVFHRDKFQGTFVIGWMNVPDHFIIQLQDIIYCPCFQDQQFALLDDGKYPLSLTASEYSRTNNIEYEVFDFVKKILQTARYQKRYMYQLVNFKAEAPYDPTNGYGLPRERRSDIRLLINIHVELTNI
eukprot:GILJ01023060.1.p1 GENE.GILJ01023060.1~~GILJ01023060.1.p1  ORF type:complete len:230 (-),score=20.55 GILJ01023060.1:1226-1915(-)